jgi:hypothetical protein
MLQMCVQQDQYAVLTGETGYLQISRVLAAVGEPYVPCHLVVCWILKNLLLLQVLPPCGRALAAHHLAAQHQQH